MTEHNDNVFPSFLAMLFVSTEVIHTPDKMNEFKQFLVQNKVGFPMV